MPAPYGAPPRVVRASAGSVNGRPSSSMPWCSSGSIIDSSVDSWPPCWVLVEVNTPAGFPTRSPLAQLLPVPSRKNFIGAAMLPKRVGLPSTSPSQLLRSASVAYGGPLAGIADAGASIAVVTAGTVRSTAVTPATLSMPRQTWRASSAVPPLRE